MSLVVLEAGLQSWLVDAGRLRSRALGVPLGGAADRFSHQLGNLLLGNLPEALALEVTLKGPTIRATVGTVAVVFGASFELQLNDQPIPANTTFRLSPNDILRIGGTPLGCRAYLCAAGGFLAPEILGSRSSLTPIVAGDVLACKAGVAETGRGLAWQPAVQLEAVVLRALPGPQAEWFALNEFFTQHYTVAPASNRMGIRLLGEPITKREAELVSEAVAPGAVQITNDGRPIVLGVDGQTIGGYPKIAHVIRADLDLLGQLRPGVAVRFQCVSPNDAEAAAQERSRQLRHWALRLAATSRH